MASSGKLRVASETPVENDCRGKNVARRLYDVITRYHSAMRRSPISRVHFARRGSFEWRHDDDDNERRTKTKTAWLSGTEKERVAARGEIRSSSTGRIENS